MAAQARRTLDAGRFELTRGGASIGTETFQIDAFIDGYGDGYVELALQLGVRPQRINTIVDFPAVEKHGVKFEGHAAAANAEVLAELAQLIDQGRLEVPIANTYSLSDVQAAYRELENGHLLGKIVLKP